VKVRVMSVDLQRNRIALSMKSEAGAAKPVSGAERGRRNEDPAAKPVKQPSFTVKPGAIAPNGMRFK
jgi:transcriptional accessory protein Tex/SPT6